MSLLARTAQENGAAPNTGDWADPDGGPAPTGEQGERARDWVELNVDAAEGLDEVVVNGADLTLYRFDDDSNDPSRTTCGAACAETWPPVLVDSPGTIHVDPGIAEGAVGFLERDGSFQVTLEGWPLYRFADDRPGEANGHEVDGTWFGAAGDGSRARGSGAGSDGCGRPAARRARVAVSSRSGAGSPRRGEEGGAERARLLGRHGRARLQNQDAAFRALGQASGEDGPGRTRADNHHVHVVGDLL